MGSAGEEVVLPFPEKIASAQHTRSTVLLSSMVSVRETGRYDEYEARLTPAARGVLVDAVAGTWIPIDVGLVHYEACESLGLPVDRQIANGRATFDKTRGIFLGTMLRMARESGVTPLTISTYFQRFWERGYDGGGICVTKLGPKEVRIELVQVRLCDCRYYRNALRGLMTGVFELFCSKAYVTELPGARPPASATFRVQWA